MGYLEEYSAIIVDDVHVRSLPTDIILAILKSQIKKGHKLKTILTCTDSKITSQLC